MGVRYTSPQVLPRAYDSIFIQEIHMMKGFREFVFRGNVIDLAVAVIIGAAFTAIVTSFVTNIVTPLIAAIVGKPDFSALILTVHGGQIKYGNFLNSVITFLLVAGVVYFMIVAPMNYILLKMKKQVVEEVTTKTCLQCLSDIPIAATRCKYCIQAV